MITDTPKVIGWREWLSLPALNIPAIKAKIDTGARTSALHTSFIEPFTDHGIDKVRFGIQPIQKTEQVELLCEAVVKDQRMVTDSGGHREMRFVIETEVELLQERWPIEITLTTRTGMRFRMLLGRTALTGKFLVDVHSSYVAGKKSRKLYSKGNYEYSNIIKK
jgi:hypothetical protein